MSYRGKCESKDKVRKDGKPKHAGNFSYTSFHAQRLQSKDYRVKMVDGELIVGDHTPLITLMPRGVVETALSDPFFGTYVQDGKQPVNGKLYEAHKRLTKCNFCWSMDDVRFIYREEIYTDGEVEYKFKNY